MFSAGIQTSAGEYEFDVIVYSTGFDAITGAYDKIDIRGTGGRELREEWRDGPSTYLGVLIHGYPNLLMPTGPQSGSASTNFPRGIESGVDWCTELLTHCWDKGFERIEATEQAQTDWTAHVAKMYRSMLMRKAKGWFTGYNSNVEGHEEGTIRYVVYNGGSPKYTARLQEVKESGYAGLELGPAPVGDGSSGSEAA